MSIVGLSHRGRRILGTMLGVAALAALVVPTAQASGPAFKPAILNVTGWTRLAAPAPAPLGVGLASAPLPAAANDVGPGSFLVIHRGTSLYGCTANFVWTIAGSPKQYLGAAGHCFLDAGKRFLGDPEGGPPSAGQWVEVCVSSCILGGETGLNARALGKSFGGNFVRLGDVVYARQTKDDRTNDVGNDFGLVEIPAGVAVRKAVPVWGGPTAPEPIGDQVCLYGNAAGFGEVFATKARAGVGLFEDAGAWYAAIPSAPGDSGAAVVNCNGLSGQGAVGILTHLTSIGIAGTTIEQAIAMVASDGLGTLMLQTP